MNALCSPVLYEDVTTDDFSSFAAGISTNKNIDQTTRLHVHHKRHWPEPSYLEILNDGWTGLWTMPCTFGVSSANTIAEYQGLGEAGRKIGKLLSSGVFPKLHTVSMGSVDEEFFNAVQGYTMEQVLDRVYGNHRKRLPLALLGIPTVRHYCQGVSYGPLALPKSFIQSKPALKIYTHHNRGGAPMFCACPIGMGCTEACQQPPIILWAINRYYCIRPYVDKYHFEFVADESNVESLFGRDIGMFTRPGIVVANDDTGVPLYVIGDIPDSAYEGTTVEFYNFVRPIDVDNLQKPPKIVAKDQRMLSGIQPPQSLARYQRAIDRMLPEVWKGKVKLFNREDAPPCSACGFHPEEEFQTYVKKLEDQEERERLWNDVD